MYNAFEIYTSVSVSDTNVGISPFLHWLRGACVLYIKLSGACVLTL